MSNGSITVPNDMNYPSLGDLRNEIMQYLHNIDDPDRILIYINRTIMDLVTGRNFWFMHAVQPITLVAGKYFYDLPLDFLREIDFRTASGKLVQISRHKLDHLAPDRTITNSGIPKFYSYFGVNDIGIRQVEIYPIQDTTVVYITYWRKIAWETDPDKLIVIPGEYSEAVVFGALWRAQKSLKDPDYIETKKEYSEAKMSMWLAEEMSTDKDFVRQGRQRLDNLPPVVKLNPDIFEEYYI
jgi:hypothetical protein